MNQQPFTLRHERAVLLVIDMQNDFVEEGACLEVPSSRKGLGKLKKLIELCREVGIPVIYTAHVHLPHLSINPLEILMFPQLKEEGLRLGTRGAEIHAEIAPLPHEVIIHKHRYDAFYETNLDAVLRNIRGPRMVDTVIITGTLTNICCESTARSAFSRDYKVVFSSDLTFAMDDESQRATLRTIAMAFGRVMDSEEIIRALRKGEG